VRDVAAPVGRAPRSDCAARASKSDRKEKQIIEMKIRALAMTRHMSRRRTMLHMQAQRVDEQDRAPTIIRKSFRATFQQHVERMSFVVDLRPKGRGAPCNAWFSRGAT
jgi:hypothetical protein